MNQTIIKALAGLGSLILLAMAYFHYTGLTPVREIAANVDDDFMRHALITNWAVFSFHLIFIALLAFGTSFYASKACAAILMAFGAWVILDGLIIWTHVMFFPGVPILITAGACYLIAGILLRRKMHA